MVFEKKRDMICTPTTTTHASTLESSQTQPGTATLTSTSLRRKRVLIADDNFIFLKALSMKLRNNGYEVITTQDGADTVSLARTGRPDLILLDINFPSDVAHGGGVSWDGLLIIDWLRRIDETRSTPIIVISGEDPIRYRERSLAAGAVAFFHKPIRPDELLPVIRRALGEDPQR
jgi:CheY-like chemotaxis protein